MSNIWDDLKNNVKEWSSAAVEKAEEVSKVAVAKTEELTRISKLKLEIHQLQRDIKKERSLLGKIVYSQAKEANLVNFTGNSEFFTIVEKIDKLYAGIKLKESEIKEIKDEFNINDDSVNEDSSLDEESFSKNQDGLNDNVDIVDSIDDHIEDEQSKDSKSSENH